MWEIFASFSIAFIRIWMCFIQKWEGGNPSWPDQPAGCLCRDSTTRGDSVAECSRQWGHSCVGVQKTANDGREDGSVRQITTESLNRWSSLAIVIWFLVGNISLSVTDGLLHRLNSWTSVFMESVDPGTRTWLFSISTGH